MPPSLLLLLLCSQWPVDCRRPPHQPTRKPHTTKTMRLPKADEGPKHSVIDFSDDIDGEPDSHGEFTMASLSKPDMPRDFTICTAFMSEAWTTDFSASRLFELRDVDGDRWAYVLLYAAESYIEIEVKLGNVDFQTPIPRVLFPLTWTRVCLSLDTVSGKVGVVADGLVLQEKVHQEALVEDIWRPMNLSIVLGYNQFSEYTELQILL